ncbi:MAG: alpha/beta hydrolase family protein [Micromonosporaceae bacterium]
MIAKLRHLTVALAVVLTASVLAWPVGSATAAPAEEGRRTYTGQIDGAEYRVETPERWNGTLLLYSHGYMPEGFPVAGVAVTNRPVPFGQATEDWLLDHGYALAASNFKGVSGYQVKQGLTDQIALLDWFEANVGRPEHTISTGQSLGASIAVLLADRHPERFDGVATFCGGYDPLGIWNAVLDITFVVKTLLAPGEDIDLVKPRDPEGSQQALQRAIDRAAATPQGRARLALAASLNNVTGWYSARLPEPGSATERILQQKEWLKNAYAFLGTVARVDLERRAGGNPSWNNGIDYAKQLGRSAQTEWVAEAYRTAGLDLDADLATLAGTPRIHADEPAVDFMYEYGVQSGRTPVPVVTLHTTGDGGAVTDQERWYAGQVRDNGDPDQLRQLYVRRGGHCSFTAAEEITTLENLRRRITTGTWPNLSPTTLNATAGTFDARYQFAYDFSTFSDGPATPSFTDFTPPRFLRPSR